MRYNIVLTGASSGIGSSLGNHLSKAGYKVIGLSRRKNTQNNFETLQCDVSKYNQLKKLISKINRVDCLINNAGIARSGIKNEVKNFDKITYSRQIPSYNIDQTDKSGSTYNSISSIEDIKIIESKVQSWIVTFPDLTNDDEKKFKQLLSEMGIQSIIKTKDTIIAIGPFIDKAMADTLSKKVQSYAGYSGQLQMINN